MYKRLRTIIQEVLNNPPEKKEKKKLTMDGKEPVTIKPELTLREEQCISDDSLLQSYSMNENHLAKYTTHQLSEFLKKINGQNNKIAQLQINAINSELQNRPK